MMNNKNNTPSSFPLDRILGIAIILSVFVMYSSTFLSDYLMDDEWSNIGIHSNIADAVRSSFFEYGRGLFGIYHSLVFSFVGYDTGRAQLIRFINVALIACLAFVLYRFLQSRTKNSIFAFLLILFWISLPSFQGIMGYSLQLISNSQPAIWLSLAAFYLYFFVFTKRPLPGFIEIAIVFVILMLAMQSTQTFAFFAAVPISFLALADWEQYKTRIIRFLSTALAAFVVSAVLYGIGLNYLHSLGNSGYALGEEGMQAITRTPFPVIINAINPIAYWSVFYLLTFPYPFSNQAVLPVSEKMALSVIVMIVWAILIAVSITVDQEKMGKDGRKQILAKWLAVLFCFGLNASFFIADSPTKIIQHRPHVILIMAGMVVFSGGYALEIVAAKYSFLQKKFVSYLACIIIVFFAFGAQSDVLRNMVDNNASQLNFMRSELAGIKSNEKINKVVVILANRNQCLSEPCDQWFGTVLQNEFHITSTPAYRYAMATIGIAPAKIRISFVSEKPVTKASDTIFIDWNTFLLAQRR